MPRPPTEASKSIDTISKVLAVLLLFIGLPCYAGIVADRSFGTSWMTPLAAVLGTFLAWLVCSGHEENGVRRTQGGNTEVSKR